MTRALVMGVSRATGWLGMALFAVLLGALVMAPVAAVGPAAVVLLPALAVAGVLASIPYSPLYMVVLTIPISVEIAGPITVARLAIVFGVMVAILQGFRRQAPFPRVMIAPGGALAAALFAWVVYATLVLDTSNLVEKLGPYIIYAAIFFVLLNYVDGVARLGHTCMIIGLMGVVQGVIVILQVNLGLGSLGEWQGEFGAALGDGEVRAVGASVHPIFLAGYFQVVLGILALLYFRATERRHRLFFIGCLLIAFLGWYYTFVRSSYVGMAAMILTWMILHSRGTRVLGITGAVTGFLILAAFDFSPSRVVNAAEQLATFGAAAQTAGLAEGSESLRWRFENITAALNMIGHAPLFGVGLEGSKQNMIAHLPPGASAHLHIEEEVPHNMYLHIAAETGLVGGALFVALWVLAFACVYRAFHVPELRLYAMALASIMVGQWVTFMINPLPREAWLTLGLAMALGRIAMRLRAETVDETDARGRAGAARQSRVNSSN